jgi:hypothetical protein
MNTKVPAYLEPILTDAGHSILEDSDELKIVAN